MMTRITLLSVMALVVASFVAAGGIMAVSIYGLRTIAPKAPMKRPIKVDADHAANDVRAVPTAGRRTTGMDSHEIPRTQESQDPMEPGSDGTPSLSKGKTLIKDLGKSYAEKLDVTIRTADSATASTIAEIAYTNHTESRAVIYTRNDTLEALRIRIYDAHGKKASLTDEGEESIPACLERSAYSGPIRFVEPLESISWSVDLGKFFNLSKGTNRISVALTSQHPVESDVVEFSVK